MTDGRNNSSWLKATDVLDVARRHEAVIYPVAVGAIEADTAGSRGGNPLPMAMGSDKAWRAGASPTFTTSDSRALLRVIADETGGRPIDAEWNRELGAVFGRILDEYRQRYILSFTPEGVGTADGWHTLDVKVKRRGLDVRSRTRYWAG